MKELQDFNQDKSRSDVELSVKQRKSVEYRLVDKLKPLEGHSVYEINELTKEIKPADYIVHKVVKWEDAVKMLKNPFHMKDIKVRKNCSYISALNASNAYDRYKKGKGSACIPKGDFKLR